MAVLDIGTNSTRLLIAEVDPLTGRLDQLERSSIVTRLGDGVDSGGRLSEAAIGRVMDVLTTYKATIERYGCSANLAVLTSAVRDAANGADFTETVRGLGLDARTLTGDQEAQLMFLGAMSDRPPSRDPTVVIDVGGGSTELVIGHDHIPTFHVSVQAGVVRMSERHIHSDPPAAAELTALRDDVRSIFAAGIPSHIASTVRRGIAVAGTATSAAAIDQSLSPYDPARVHGYTLPLTTIDALLDRLSGIEETSRRQVVGLHPDRAPTIVAGMILLQEACNAFSLTEVEVSEHDILRGGALRLAGIS